MSSLELVPLRGADHGAVLREALRVRDDGGVPLVGDERWSDAHWESVVAQVRAGLERMPDTAGHNAAVAWASFTSGSTAAPKVVLRSAASWEVAFEPLSRLLGVAAGDTLLIPVHPVSSMALFAAAHAHHSGLEIAVPGRHRVRAEDLVGPAVVHCTPLQLGDIVELLEAGSMGLDTESTTWRSTLRAALVGGARLAPELRARAERCGLSVVSYYGAAELSLVAVDQGSGLRAWPGVELEDRDGVLWVRSQQCALVRVTPDGAVPIADAQGWASVGDRVRWSDDGALVPQGRSDGAMLTAGATVVPEDVEAVLEQHPDVDAALVYGEDDAVLGQRVCARIQWRGGVRAEVLRDIRAFAREHLTPAQRPRRWQLVDALPRTASGKVLRVRTEGTGEIDGGVDA
ncbi:ANL family adenylate-forming protein [Citricoccus muralis]|uniref:Fatty acid--CoA ligase family protein n=1 Tax=Citricoccus muralis TaxID=169134 RepID=A0ABY8H5H4_9MICC|nr:fatty acid--CoA ligase family protein [Citricoccus muralis]WFP16389.1 fatty acid--CoA ligase family protein [Citricoccus muralis]